MNGLIIEQGSFGNNPSTKDLVRHLFTRMSAGQIVIVADKPMVFISMLRKQWLKLERKLRTERSTTLDAQRVQKLTKLSATMMTLRFTTNWPPEDYEPANVYVLTLEQLLRWAPEAECRTLYVTAMITKEQLYIVTSWMGSGGLVVNLVTTTNPYKLALHAP